MSRIALIVGHSRHGDQGAPSRWIGPEWPWNWDLAERTETHICDHNTRVFERTEGISQVARDVNEWGADAALSMHFNSVNNPAATGTEMLHWYTSGEGQKLAQMLQDEVLDALGLHDRGLKPRRKPERGWRILASTAMPCVIAEPFFGSNRIDALTAEERKDSLADAYANALQTYVQA